MSNWQQSVASKADVYSSPSRLTVTNGIDKRYLFLNLKSHPVYLTLS